MAKKINAGTITDNAIIMLSSYNQATLVLRKLAEEYKEENARLVEEKEKVLEARQKALDEGKSLDVVAQEFSIVESDKAIKAAAEKYKADCEPWRAAQRNARKLVSKDIYESYVQAYSKGKLTAYEADVKNYLASLGIQVPTVAQLTKIAKVFVVRTSGSRRASSKKAAEGHYISEKSKVQYCDIFMLAILEWLVTEKKVLKVLPDNTLVRVIYDVENK